MAFRIDIEVDLTVRKVVESLLNSSNQVDAFQGLRSADALSMDLSSQQNAPGSDHR
jgi:hypothetical protein